MRAGDAVRLADFLEIGAGLVFVVENRIGQIDGHRGRPCLCPHSTYGIPFVKDIIATYVEGEGLAMKSSTAD